MLKNFARFMVGSHLLEIRFISHLVRCYADSFNRGQKCSEANENQLSTLVLSVTYSSPDSSAQWLCCTWGKWHELSEPQFPNLWMWKITVLFRLWGGWIRTGRAQSLAQNEPAVDEGAYY